MPAEAAVAIGPYRVQRSLGSGGMGEVLLAYDPRLDRRVAIKRIRSDAAMDPWNRARFRREAKLAAKLSHPGIVQVFDLLSEDGAEHIVMEYVPGDSLRTSLGSLGIPPLAQALSWALEITGALSYAHRHGVIHRDLKSENVLVGPGGEVKIADFGIARRLLPRGDTEHSASLTREGAVVGTLRAMAPEQVRGEEADPRSDLFSLGVLLYEMLTGRSPFRAGSSVATATRILEHHPPPVDSLNRQVPPELSALIGHLLEKNRRLRPRDAGEVIDGLRSIQQREEGHDGEATAQPSTSGAGAPRGILPSHRIPRWAWAGVLLAASAGLLLRLAVPSAVPPEPSPLPPIHVAVLDPVSGPGPETEAMAFLVRSALLKHLLHLRDVYPKTRAEVDAASGSSRQVGRAVAADEIVETALRCRLRGCQLELGVFDLSQDRLRWLDHGQIPTDDPILATRAVGALLQRAYEDRSATGGGRLEVGAEDFRTYLEVHRAFGARGEAEGHSVHLETLASLRKRSPGFVDAYVLEAEIALRRYLETRDRSSLDRALKVAGHAERLAPESSEVLYLRTRLDIAAGDLQAAEEKLARLEEMSPADPELLYHRTEVLFAQGRLQEAEELARRTAEKHPSARYLYRHAAIASRLGKMDLSREVLAELLERSPDHFDGRELSARIEMITGDLEKAAELYEGLVAESPGATELGNLGNILLLLDRPAEAAEVFDRLLRQAPEDTRTVLNLADARVLSGESAEARRLYQRVLRDLEAYPPPFESQRLTLGAQALAHLGRKQEAVAAAHEALQVSPEDGHVAYEAALVFAVAGERNSALASFRKAMSLGFDAVWFRYPWFEPLREDTGFERQVWGRG